MGKVIRRRSYRAGLLFVTWKHPTVGNPHSVREILVMISEASCWFGCIVQPYAAILLR